MRLCESQLKSGIDDLCLNIGFGDCVCKVVLYVCDYERKSYSTTSGSCPLRYGRTMLTDVRDVLLKSAGTYTMCSGIRVVAVAGYIPSMVWRCLKNLKALSAYTTLIPMTKRLLTSLNLSCAAEAANTVSEMDCGDF